MQISSTSRFVAAALVLSLGSACGGSGYGGGGGGGGPSQAVLVSSLSGASEINVVDPSARGSAVLDAKGDGQLDFAVTGESTWVGSVTGLELRLGAAGQVGSNVVNLLGGGATFDLATRTVSGSLTINPAVASALLGNPANYFIQVRTTAAPQGLVRGQTEIFTGAELHAVLLGSLETPVTDADAHGGVTLRVAADRSLSWVIAMGSPTIDTIVNAHIHAGDPALLGAIVLDLDSGSATLDAGAGTLAGDANVPVALMARIAYDPSEYYVNAHTVVAPAGIVRGNLATGDAEVWAVMRGDQEVVVVDAASRGAVGLVLESFSSGHAYLAVPIAQGIAGLTGATVNVGGAGAEGAMILDLRAGADFANNAPTGTAEGSIALDQALYARLIGTSVDLYASFTTGAAPTGLVRGQLTQAPQTATALLTGLAQVPPADPAGFGLATVVFTGIHACSFTADMTNPIASAVVGFHIHDGVAGVNGPIVIDLIGGEYSVVGSSIIGGTTFTGGTFTRLMADPAAFYANAHSLPFPNGAARGQFVLLSESTPPSGLTYTTPVVYTIGSAIAANVPHSSGGAVGSYSVLPALPAGLAISGSTGIISGTPTTATAAADYVVTATNVSGSAQATVHITVTVAAPSNLVYTSPVVYVTGSAITPNAPTNSGGTITSYSVLPALPAGLSIDGSTGVISGTPTAVTAGADYTVTGTNPSGSTPAVVHIQVDSSLPAPSGLSYATPVSYTTGTAITANTPTVGGGAVATWSITPALPTGLAFSTSSGVISGTPTVVTAAADYVVTATNATGSTQATVNVTVTLGAPANIQYDNDPGIGYVAFSSWTVMTPTASGGAVTSWSIAPTTGSYTLPAGLNFSTTTGVISGTPTAANYPGTNTSFTVTATNATGSTTKTITVIVY